MLSFLYFCASLCVRACFDLLVPATRECCSHVHTLWGALSLYVHVFCGMCWWDILSTYGMGFLSTAVAAFSENCWCGCFTYVGTPAVSLCMCIAWFVCKSFEDRANGCTAHAFCARLDTGCVCVRALSRV